METLRLFLGFVIVTRRATFAASNPCLVAGPLVGGALFMRGASTSPGNLDVASRDPSKRIHDRDSYVVPRSALCHIDILP